MSSLNRCHGTIFSSHNPATDELVWQGCSANREDVDERVASARTAFSSWSKCTFEERATFTLRFLEKVKAHQNDLATVISQEMGKPIWESFQEVESIKNKVEISIEAFQERCAKKCRTLATSKLITRYHPHGIVA